MKALNYSIFLPFLLFFLGACHVTKNVPGGYFLLKKNKVVINGTLSSEINSEINSIIRQQPNQRILGIPFKLMLFNSIDSSKVAEKRMRLNIKLTEKNEKIILKTTRINEARIEKARSKGKKLYTEKIIPLIDIESSRLFFRQWLKYKIAEKPVVYDTILYNKSIDQIRLFLKRKGYYYGNVSGSRIIDKKHKILKKNCESLYFDIATKGFEEISQNKEKYE